MLVLICAAGKSSLMQKVVEFFPSHVYILMYATEQTIEVN